MRATSQLLISLLLNACWQIALICACAALCSLLLRSAAAKYQHALWVAALLLSICVPVFSSLPAVTSTEPNLQAAAEPIAIQPIVQTDSIPSTTNLVEVSKRSPIHVGSRLVAIIIALYSFVVVFSSIKLCLAWRRTRSIIQTAHTIETTGQVQTTIDNCARIIGVDRVNVLFSSIVPVPITAGFRNPSIILPEKFMTEVDVDLLISGIGHEMIHVARRDYVLNLLYEVIYLPLSFHPAAVFMRRKISQTRELCCDELVTEKLQSARVYARSLVRLAESAPRLGRLAATTTVGIADADNLEVRVMSLLRKPKVNQRRKTLLLFAASLLLALPCVAAASFALHINVDPQEPAFEDKRLKPLYRAEPEYPQDAREQKVEGTVGLLVTVDPKGAVQDVEVTQPVFPSLDESAAKAVRKWQFAPYYLNGQAVTRKLMTEVNFNINSWQQDKSREEKERMERERGEREKEKSGQDAEMQYKRELEIEFKAKAQAELARHARISMDQAIRIATSKYPGTVMNCSLNAEHWEKPGVLAPGSDVLYHVVIVSTNENDDGPTHVLVSATDGRIVKIEKEKRRERQIGVAILPINGGVLNGKAISLPAPVYPDIARQAGAEGTVTVAVVIDEEGNVIEARAASGHPLLQSAAVSASREAKFSPTRLEGEPVRVRGVITYNFVRN